jgi:uncharacterized damage-inducible protein DinB
MTEHRSIERPDPPDIAGELDMLTGWLDFHRATLVRKCDGLDADQLARRAVPPSTLSLLGLVRHMVDVEQNWFDAIAGRTRVSKYWDADNDDFDFDGAVADPEAVHEAFADLQEAIEQSRAVLAQTTLDATFDRVRRIGEQTYSVRWVLVHMVEEYARHNGHADLLREAIDGATGS